MSDTPYRLTAGEDRLTERVSTKVITAVADHTDTDPTELPPLFHVIDPDALDQLFQSKLTSAESITGQVTFTMAGCEVVVDSSGQVTVTSSDQITKAGSRSK